MKVFVIGIGFVWAMTLCAEDARVAAAVRQLGNGFPEVRAEGIIKLGELGARQYTKQIVALIKSDPDFQVRYFGVQVLGKLEAKEYAPDIAEFLKDRVQAQVRLKAAEILGRFAAKGYDPAIAKLLKHNEPMVRGRLAHAMGTAGAKAYAKDIAPLCKQSFRCTLYEEKTREYRLATTVGKIATDVLQGWGIQPPEK